MPPSPSLIALALEIHDALALVATAGWRTVRMDLTRGSDGTLRVAQWTTTLSETRTRARPDLGIEPGAMFGVLNEAANDLAALTRSMGIAWSGESLLAERDGDTRALLSLADASARIEHTIELGPGDLDELLFTDALFTAAAESEPAIERLERALDGRAEGHTGWGYDQESGVLDLTRGNERVLQVQAEAIGSYAFESETWLWAWANPAIDPERARLVRSVRDWAARQTGLSAFCRPTLPCAESFADTLARIVATRGGAQGIYRAVFGKGVLLLAITG